MASRAILRKKKFLLDSIKRPPYMIQGSLCSEQGKLLEIPDSKLCARPVNPLPSGAYRGKKEDSHSLTKPAARYILTKTYIQYDFYGGPNFRCEIGTPGGFTGFRWASEYARYLSTAAAGQPDLGGRDDKNEEPAIKQKKEPSPEECDQAVEGLSSIKAKAKAKAKAEQLLDPQKGANFVLKRIWAMLLGIGPALKSVASMSRLCLVFFILLFQTLLFRLSLTFPFYIGRTGLKNCCTGRMSLSLLCNTTGWVQSYYGLILE